MACLVDTGVLLRAFDADAVDHLAVRQSLRELLIRKERRVAALQNLAEFWNVSTRPSDKNGYGLSLERVTRRMHWVEQFCDVVTEDGVSLRLWKDLLTTYSITGVTVHDARLVSVMLAHGISHILTLNDRDFRRYGSIVVLTSGDLIRLA